MEKRPLTLLHPLPPPSDVFINSSQIQLVGLFVRRVSLSSPLHLLLPLLSNSLLPLSSAVSRVLSSTFPSLPSRENERTKTGKLQEGRKEISPVFPQLRTRYLYRSWETINFLMVSRLTEITIFVNDRISRASSSIRSVEYVDPIKIENILYSSDSKTDANLCL